MNAQDRQRFDALLEQVIAELPENLRRRLDEVPLLADDRPDADTCRKLGVNHTIQLCGLYTGIPLTERSVQHSGVLPDRVRIFREGIVAAARGGARGAASDRRLKREIRRTVLHEIGHHFGLGEAELRELGY